MRDAPAVSRKMKGGVSMIELEKYIETIRKDYPDTITKEQFYKIAHISKYTARWLLQSGLVPCRDSGMKTRRYTIKIEDVIEYLKTRAIHPHRYDIPTGYRPGSKIACRKGFEHRDLFIHMDEGQRAQLRNYFETYLRECDDLISVSVAARMLGYSQSAIVKWCVTGRCKAFLVSGKYLIPKICLIDYLMSAEAMCVCQKSFRHEVLLSEFLEKHKTSEQNDS